jgi:purine-binding chemotaxis protein CheW
VADRETSVDREASQRIMEERARVLARPLRAEEPADTLELVVLTLGPERYGVDSRRAREVHPLADLAPVPGTPPFWAGIVNVRGTLYPVLDLHRYLELPEVDAGERQKKVVLVSGSKLTVGLLVDDAPGIRRVPATDVGPPLGGTSEAARRIVRGVTDDLLTVLDVDALLSDPRLTLKEEPS